MNQSPISPAPYNPFDADQSAHLDALLFGATKTSVITVSTENAKKIQDFFMARFGQAAQITDADEFAERFSTRTVDASECPEQDFFMARFGSKDSSK